MIALALPIGAVVGMYLVFTAFAYGRSDVMPIRGDALGPRRPGSRLEEWLAQAGLEDVDQREFVAVLCALALLGATVGWVLFASLFPACALAIFGASFPIASYRRRRKTRKALALDAWPRLIEEIRVLTGSLGRSIPQALFEVGLRGPEELRPSFAAAHREWLISTDFERTIGVLKTRLADATADVVCETLLVAYQVGGSEIGRRLEALADDRTQDAQGRKDARSRQAGARFARRFVLFVPLGMALAGMSVGNGRAAYRTVMGQTFVLIGIALVAVCWLWAGRVMQLPDEERVFSA